MRPAISSAAATSEGGNAMMARSALMDVGGVTREVEAAFVAMYELKYREGKSAP